MRQCTNTSLVSLFYAAQKTSIGPVKDWESIGDNLLKAAWSSACIQIRITTADNFGLWPQRVKTRNAFIFRADGVLTVFIELEATISTHSLGRTYE